MIKLILFFFLSIGFSFLCSIWEAVLLSVTSSYVSAEKRSNTLTGKLFYKFKDDIDKPLSAILSLNTIAHTVGAIGVGAQAGAVYGSNFFNLFGLKVFYESIIAGLMTLAILILSEIIPKTIGANNWKSLAPFTAKSLRILMFILKPLIWLSTLITKSLKKNKDESILSRQDFREMTHTVGETGQIKESEYKIINNLLQFEELTAKDIMTPRVVIKMAKDDIKAKDFYDENPKLVFSRIPLYSENKDDITGLLLKDDLLVNLIEGKNDKPLKDIARAVNVVNENLKLPALLDYLSEKRDHMVLVVNEYGGLQGLVTLEDLFETLMGKEILDETDNISDLQEYARKKWKERAKKLGLSEI